MRANLVFLLFIKNNRNTKLLSLALLIHSIRCISILSINFMVKGLKYVNFHYNYHFLFHVANNWPIEYQRVINKSQKNVQKSRNRTSVKKRAEEHRRNDDNKLTVFVLSKYQYSSLAPGEIGFHPGEESTVPRYRFYVDRGRS